MNPDLILQIAMLVVGSFGIPGAISLVVTMRKLALTARDPGTADAAKALTLAGIGLLGVMLFRSLLGIAFIIESYRMSFWMDVGLVISDGIMVAAIYALITAGRSLRR